MEYRYYIDGTLYDEPVQGNDVTITLQRDDTIKGLLKKFSSPLKFYGDAFQYISDKRNQIGFNYQFDVTIQYRASDSDSWHSLIQGMVNVSDIKITLYPFNTAEFTIEDNSFTSLINNNRACKAYIDVGLSKNGVSITACTPLSVETFDSATGGVLGSFDMFSVDDVFRFIVAYITDGQVTYSSPLFGTGGNLEGVMITSGYILSTSATTVPYVSFEDLFTEMDKRWNISFYIDYTAAVPEIVIDRTDSIYSTDVSLVLRDPNQVFESYDKSKLYSVVKFGTGTNLPYDGAFANFPDNRFLGWKEEEYNITGQANINATLDLTCQWVSDSNVINTVVNTAVTDYDEQTFIVIASYVRGAWRAVKYDDFNIGGFPVYYNLPTTNYNVAKNYLGYIPNSITAAVGLLNNGSKAVMSADTLIAGYGAPATYDIVFDDDAIDGYDPANNYNAVTGRYTCPLSGLYNFNLRCDLYVSLFSIPAIGTDVCEIFLRRYDNGGTLLQQQSLTKYTYLGGGVSGVPAAPTTIEESASYYLNDGGGTPEYVMLELDTYVSCVVGIQRTTRYDHYEANNYSYYQVNAPTDGNIWAGYNPNAFINKNYDFSYPLGQVDIQTLLANNQKRVNFALQHVVYGGWVKEVNIHMSRAMVDFKLVEYAVNNLQ